MKIHNKILLAALVMLLLVTTGCFGDPVKSDLEEYLNFEMSNQSEMQDISLDMIGNMGGAIQSKDQLVNWMNNAKVKLVNVTEKQKAYQPKTKEVQDIHAKELKMLDLSMETFDQMLTMVNSNTPPSKETLNGLIQKQQEIVKLAQEYQKDLKTLGEQKKVEVKLKF